MCETKTSTKMLLHFGRRCAPPAQNFPFPTRVLFGLDYTTTFEPILAGIPTDFARAACAVACNFCLRPDPAPTLMPPAAASCGNPERNRFPCSSDSAGGMRIEMEWAVSFGVLPLGRGRREPIKYRVIDWFNTNAKRSHVHPIVARGKAQRGAPLGHPASGISARAARA